MIWSPNNASSVSRQRRCASLSASLAMLSLISICGAPARKPSSTSGGQSDTASLMICCAVDSPRPKVCRRRMLRPGACCTCAARSATMGPSMAASSLGTPGVQIMRQLPNVISKPTALPIGLSTIVAPCGSIDCFRLAASSCRLRLAHQRSRWATACGCSCSGTPATAAKISAVRSSIVGPNPPLTIMRSALVAISASSVRSRVTSSPTVTLR